jgi:hypothetical protein
VTVEDRRNFKIAAKRPINTRRKVLFEGPDEAVESSCWNVRAQLAQTEETPPAYLEQLASDPVPAVRQAIALNPNCPPELLARLVNEAAEVGRSGGDVLKRRVALHPNVPESTLVELAASDDSSILIAVGRNPRLTDGVAESLIATGNGHAILSVATNSALSDAAKRRLGVQPLPQADFAVGVQRAVRHFDSWANEQPWNLRTRQLVRAQQPLADKTRSVQRPVGVESQGLGKAAASG